ncbi:MAG: hypothetical protein P8Z79_23135 [Sedimentisphaerales bacterium]|jgi:hypothetical protein
MKRVVDTNVPVVANGSSKQASPECVRTCAVRLGEIVQEGQLVLDDNWLILKEYMANLRCTGQPGPGDAFLKWALTNHRNPKLCEQVAITPRNSGETDFEEFPADPALDGFDPADRKFVAVAVAHRDRPPILQAVDTKWWQMKKPLLRAGITVDFLCEADIRSILRGKNK